MKLMSGPSWRAFIVGFKAIVLFTVCTIVYTGVVTGISQVAMSDHANGSPVYDAQGQVVGSRLLGQNYTDSSGQALPEYLQPRPSAAGDEGYDARSSSGTNYGPENQALIDDIAARQQEIAEREGVEISQIPAEAVTSSSSGLDADISPEYAKLQVPRIAQARHVSEQQVQEVIDRYTTGPDLGYLGESKVNVVQVNLALDQL